MIKSLKNIQSAFSHVRIFIILLVASNLSIILFTMIYSSIFKSSQSQKIYALQGEKELMVALNQNTTDNRLEEAKATVTNFHELFFNIIPDKRAIEYKIRRALLMADNSAYNVYKNLSDNNYYDQIIDAKIICQYKCDSIKVNFTKYPYHVMVYGKTSIVRTSGTTFRNLLTSCQLRNCARSEATPHGFLIENWEVVDNSDISISKLYN